MASEQSYGAAFLCDVECSLHPVERLEEQVQKIEIVEMDVDELVPYAGNAKLHPKEQVQEIAQSILDYGFNDPIAIWHNEQGEPEIVEGHGRLLALKKLRHKKVPTIVLDHLSDEARRAYTHIHNQLAIIGGFDMEALEEEIDRLDVDMSAYGFSFDELPEPSIPEVGVEQHGEVFDVLFVYFNEEEAEHLKKLLGVNLEKARYEFEEVAL